MVKDDDDAIYGRVCVVACFDISEVITAPPIWWCVLLRSTTKFGKLYFNSACWRFTSMKAENGIKVKIRKYRVAHLTTANNTHFPSSMGISVTVFPFFPNICFPIRSTSNTFLLLHLTTCVSDSNNSIPCCMSIVDSDSQTLPPCTACHDDRRRRSSGKSCRFIHV